MLLATKIWLDAPKNRPFIQTNKVNRDVRELERQMQAVG